MGVEVTKTVRFCSVFICTVPTRNILAYWQHNRKH